VALNTKPLPPKLAVSLIGKGKQEYAGKTTDLPNPIDKYYHIIVWTTSLNEWEPNSEL
jgi:hypothetical protein